MYGWILFGVMAVYLLISVGIGFLRGLSKTRIRTITIFASALIAYITVLVSKNSLLMGPSELEDVLIQTGMYDQAQAICQLLIDSPVLTESVLGFLSAMVMPLVYLVLFLVISIVLGIIGGIVTFVLRGSLKAHNSRAHMRGVRTLALSLFSGLVVLFVWFVPVNVYTQMIPPVVAALEETDVIDAADVEGVIDESISENAVLGMFRVFAGEPVCNSITSFKVGEESVKLLDEVGGITKFVGNIVSLSGVDMENFGEEQTEVFDSIASCFDDSNLLAAIIGEVIYHSTDAWIADEDFIGVERPEVGEMLDPTFDTLINVLHSDARKPVALKADIYTVADMIGILARYDVFSKMEDTDSLIEQLGADGMVKELITALGSNSSMKVLIGEIRNMGMRAIAQALDIPANGEVVYEQFLGDIATALNDTKSMSEEERVETLTQKVKDAFVEANVPIEEEIIDCYSASLIYDLGSMENITADDISDFFTAYAMKAEQGEEDNNGGNDPIAYEEKVIFRGSIYSAMSAEQLANSGASVLATVTVQLSKVEGDTATVIEASAVILKENYAALFTENNPVMNKINAIEIKEAIDKSAVENTASMKQASTMNSGVITLEKLLADVNTVAEAINEETIAQEAEALSGVFSNATKLISGEVSMESVEDVVKTIGPVLDSLQSSVSVGESGTADLLVATLQTKTFRENANIDMTAATNLGKKATESQNGEKVDYEKTMNSVAGVVTLGNSISTGEIASEEDIRELIENLTPQTAAVLREFVTEERMKEYGMPEENAGPSASLLVNLFDYLAGDIPESEFDHEAKAIQQLLNIATAAKDDTSETTRLFGAEGKLKKSAYELIEIIIESNAVCHSVDKTLNGEGEKTTDPFGIGKQIPEESEDKQEFDAAVAAYRQAHPSEETDRRLNLVADLFGVAHVA